MSIQEITKEEVKVKIAEEILRELPEWFGIPEAVQVYVEQAKKCKMIAYFVEEQAVGFITINQKFSESSEIDAMGILPEYHHQGIGRQLILAAKGICQRSGSRFLQVKTLAESHPDPFYKKTRKFYAALGFVPLDIFSELWGKENPCLQLILQIEPEE